MVLSGLRLSRQQLKRLEEHRYSSEGRSLLELLMQPFWCWLVERVPLWVAPNLITTIGLVLNITTTLILAYHCPTATEQSSIDVTEVQIFIITVYLLAALGGAAFWQSVIPVLDVQMKMIPAFLTGLGAIFSCTNYFRVIFTGGMGKNGSTIAGTSVLSPAFHIAAVLVLAVLVYKTSAEQLFEKNPCLFVLAFGFGSAKLTNRLVVAHMTKSEMQRSDAAFVAPLLLVINQYFNSFFSEHVLLWGALVLSACDLVCYCTSVCKQIAAHLNISVFSLQKPKTCRNNHH
ncbi:hypothetical protein PDJAM_G00236880 [Pangasius djambal]|uniref:Uncharacterized protein n=1 Tax=Pangasius djambal TaxID=1691987 RepID=A0ACC5YFZ0_9TELE|nr:hypothetical protein [Pangasius djambal]